MATDTGLGEVRFFDDFLGDAIDTFNWTANSDGGGTAAIYETENGVLRLYNAGNSNQIESIFGAEIWQPNTAGTIVFEARVSLVTSLTQGVFIGLSDENDADEMPADLDGGSLTLTAGDCAGFCYDNQEDAYWHIVSNKASSAGTQTNTLVGPTLATYQTFRIVVESNGDCRFFIDGDEITVSGAAREAAITTSVQYCPCVGRLCSGTAGSAYVDYVYVSQGRV